MRTETAQEGCLEAISNAFPQAEVEFKSWNGDKPLWPLAVESADQEAWRLAFELATLPKEVREETVLVGHSLGGRMTARILAHLAEKGLKVKRAYLMAAAIPHTDPDLRMMGGGAREPVTAICNPDDVTLRYVYAIAGGENAPAFGANGTVEPIENVVECVTPTNITEGVSISGLWGRAQVLKDIANHHALFYLDYLGVIRRDAAVGGTVMVPQDLPVIRHQVLDAGVWWDVIDEMNGWKLERHKVTRHYRVLTPESRCVAWGGEKEMKAAFEKVRRMVIQSADENRP